MTKKNSPPNTKAGRKHVIENSESVSSRLDGPEILKFERADWTSFRTFEGLQQKAGVAKARLRAVALKELADNALDTGAPVVKAATLGKDRYVIEDEGPGIDPADIPRLFSINRPMISTKLLRMPTRGALGNGLRVVAGAVLASKGSLVVTSRNRRLTLRPEHDGSTTVLKTERVKFSTGTQIMIGFGPALPGSDDDALVMAESAIAMAQGGSVYKGRSSPHWYDASQFHELLSAARERPVREVIASLDGCTGAKAGEIIAAAGLGRALCLEVTATQAAKLLTIAKRHSEPVNPKRLGRVGPELFSYGSYAVAYGGEGEGVVPFVVEAWAEEETDTEIAVSVNKTPITGRVYASRDKRDINLHGCGLNHTVAQAPKDSDFSIRLNIITPYMPITSDGKTPNLRPFLDEIATVIRKVVTKARRPTSKDGQTIKSVMLDNLDNAIEAVSGGYRFGERQLFYALRGVVRDATGEELKIGNFKSIITDYESEYGEIKLMYREPRGSIYHPHIGEVLTLGTLMVEEYERPAWRLNKLLYIEKEGFAEVLKDERWAERHDCAVLSSKGFSTRAARDLIDLLAEHDEPVQVFCAHDADSSGTMIYQTLQHETKARGARKVEIINLGLEPQEALAMGLEIETLEPSTRHKPVADYVSEKWTIWLQAHRIELNAMTNLQLIAWLDHKLKPYSGKLIPPADVLEAELRQNVEHKVRAAETERILREVGLDDLITARMASIKLTAAPALVTGIKRLFKRQPDREWRDHIEAIATDTVRKIERPHKQP